VPNLTLPNLNLAALAGLTQGNVGMFNMPSLAPVAPAAPVVAPKPVVAPVATQVAPMVSTAPPVSTQSTIAALKQQQALNQAAFQQNLLKAANGNPYVTQQILSAQAAASPSPVVSSIAPIAPVVPVVPPAPVVAPMATPVAPVAPTAPVAAPMASTAPSAPMISADEAARILSSLNLEAISGASGMFGVPGATSSTITNPYTPAYVFNPDVSLVGATDIFGGRTYESPLATPGKTRVGYSEMLQLNQAPGYVATNRPEQIGDIYLPYRPSGEGAQVADDIKTWYEYYTDNEDFRKFLSADEQTELAWLDYRNNRFTQEGFTNKINDIREQFNLPKKVGFEDFEAHFSFGTKRKKYSDNPYADLQEYGPAIGGYWNPENDPSEFQQAMANPIVNAALTTAGAVIGNMLLPGVGGQALGSALASGTSTKLSGADWEDALKAAAVAGGSAYLGGKLAGPASAPVGEFNIPAVDFGAVSAPLGGINTDLISSVFLSPVGSSAIANPVLNLAAPSFFQTALGQGLGKAGVALASGGDIKDALTAGVLGYAGAPGGLLSGTLGDTLGLDLGTSTLAKGVEGLNLADALKFGINLPQDQWSAVGGVLGDMNLGTVGQSDVLSSLPASLQNIVENVQVSDLLANIGGPSTSSLFNIASDLNLPSLNINLPNVNLPNIDFPNINLPDLFDNGPFELPNIPLPTINLPDLLNVDLPNLPDIAVNLPSNPIDLSGINLPDIAVNVPETPIDLPNLPDIAVNVPDVPKVDTPNLDLQKLFAGLFGAGMLARPQQAAPVYSSPEYKPFMANIAYDPRIQQLTPIAASDPLSVLLQAFYKVRVKA